MDFPILLEKELTYIKTALNDAALKLKWNVLIVEIDENESNLYSSMESRIGVAILRAKDTQQFWNQIEFYRSAYKNIEIILISQKADFNVAYQAIQHRISHFLLEPVEDDSFVRIFTEIEEKLRILETEKEKEQILMSYELEQHQKLMAKIMTQMMEKPEELAIMMGEVNERYHTKLTNTYFGVIQIVVLDLLPSSHKEVIMNKVQNVCREKIVLGSEMIFSTRYHFELSIVVNMESEVSNQEFMIHIQPLLQEMQTLMEREEVNEWAIGIGPIVDELKDVQKSADCAIFALHNWNLNQKMHVFTAFNHNDKLEDKIILDQVRRKKYQKLIRQLQLEELEQLMEENMRKCLLVENPYEMQQLTVEVLQLTEEIWSSQIELNALEGLLSKELFSYIFNNQKKTKALLRLLAELEVIEKGQTASKGNSQIRKALEYIHAHSNEAITMEKVALEVDLSPNYFSNLFREEMGVNYLDYVTEYRLNQSKELLEKSDLTLEEIAGEIGYRDVKYYSQLFKKYYETTPGKYRKSVIEQRKTEG